MGIKVSARELEQLKETVSRNLKNLDNDANDITKSINDVISLEDFKGRAADSVKKYSNAFHLKLNKDLKDISKEFVTELENTCLKFSEIVESNSKCKIDEDALRQYQKKFVKHCNNIYDDIQKYNTSLSNVNHLVSADLIQYESLKEVHEKLEKNIDKLIDKLYEFIEMSVVDGDTVSDNIKRFSNVTSYASNMDSNRSTIGGIHHQINVKYQFYSPEAAVLKTREALKNYTDISAHNPEIIKTATKHESYKMLKQMSKEYYVMKKMGYKNAKAMAEAIQDGSFTKRLNKLDKESVKRLSNILDRSFTKGNIKSSVNELKKIIKNKKIDKSALVKVVDAYDDINPKDIKSKTFNKNKILNNLEYFNNKSIQNALLKDENGKKLSKKEMMELFKERGKKDFKKIFLPDYFDDIIKHFNDAKGSKKWLLKAGKNIFVEQKQLFKNLNVFGKIKMLGKLGTKAMTPLAIALSAYENFKDTTKSLQHKIVGTIADSTTVMGTMYAGMAIGTMIPVPIVGTAIGAAAGLGLGFYAKYRKFGSKTITEHLESGLNHAIDKTKSKIGGFASKLGNGFKSVFG